MNNEMMKRLLEFASLILCENCKASDVSALAHQKFFAPEEQDTFVFSYGPFDEMEHQSEADMVVKFLHDSGMKVHIAWQGVSVTLEVNLPDMGWDHENGEFGLGGDWWKIQ